jgi:RTX calcium-binding nonapeptide repeat (4 copies)
MPATPVSWSVNDFPANTNFAGTQNSPVITQLANGNVLICWTDLDNTIGTAGGSAAGLDVVGRIFDPLGNAVTDEIRLNVFSSSQTECIPEITALDNGGFMLVYGSTGAGDDILYETYSASGSRQNGGYVIDDAAGGAAPGKHAVASAASTSVMTAYVVDNADGSEDVWVRPFNPATNSFGAAFLKWAGSAGAGEDNGGVGIAALANDNFALAFGNRNALDDTVVLNIINATGGTLHSATITTGTDINGVQCAGLSGGNVAIVYHDFTSGPVYAAVYSSTAGVVRSAFQISGLSANQRWSSVAALADGGFVVVWDDDVNSDIRGRRFDSSGNGVGLEFTVDTAGTQSFPRVTGLADGRFQITWEEDGDIRSEIFDGRDSVNSPGVYAPDQWQVGTINADVFTNIFNAEIVHGWAGNDIITEGGIMDAQYFGDTGNDTFVVTSFISGDSWDGGADNDTINWSGSGEVGATYNLDTGTAVSSLAVEQMLNFENLVGTGNFDVILGTTGANYLDAGGGDDFVYGGGGNDAMVGGTGNDTMYGGIQNDTLLMDNYTTPAATSGADTGHGDAGDDLIWGYGGNDILYGDNDNDNIVGNDYASAVTGTDSLYGGAGNDILFVGLGGNAYMDGGAGNDTFFGGVLGDILRGGTGNDYLYGNAGADFFQFYNFDFANGDKDIIYFVDAGDRLQFNAALNGNLFFQNLASLEYAPSLFTTGVYITAFLGGGATATVTVYGTTVAALAPLVEYTL